jgi:hypothetical protein
MATTDESFNITRSTERSKWNSLTQAIAYQIKDRDENDSCKTPGVLIWIRGAFSFKARQCSKTRETKRIELTCVGPEVGQIMTAFMAVYSQHKARIPTVAQ